MARANIIVTPKKKAKKDRELKKQLKELEKFKPKELIPLEEISKQSLKINDNNIAFSQIEENKPKKKRKKSVKLYQRKHKQKVDIKNKSGKKSKNKSGKKPKSSTAKISTPILLIKDVNYIPTVDIFDMIEDAIYNKIPNETMIWKKGHKGGIPIDLTSLKQQAIFIIRDFASSDDKEIENYFRENENAIMEAIDGFTYSSTSAEFASLTERFLNLINMGHALSADAMYYNEISEMLDFY